MGEERVVVVTGGASGMGRSHALRFANDGAAVAVLDRDGDGAERVSQEIRQAGGKSLAVRVDVTVSEEIPAAIREVETQLGPIHVLVNNAGIFDQHTASLDTSRNQWDVILAVNATSVFEMTNAVLPSMIARGGGVVINVSSVAGVVAGKGGAAYTTSKHAVIGYTKHIASAYGPSGIRANAVLPGTIETPLTEGFLAEIPTAPIPLRRFGADYEVSGLVAYLASDEASFISGASVTIDGGFTIQ